MYGDQYMSLKQATLIVNATKNNWQCYFATPGIFIVNNMKAIRDQAKSKANERGGGGVFLI